MRRRSRARKAISSSGEEDSSAANSTSDSSSEEEKRKKRSRCKKEAAKTTRRRSTVRKAPAKRKKPKKDEESERESSDVKEEEEEKEAEVEEEEEEQTKGTSEEEDEKSTRRRRTKAELKEGAGEKNKENAEKKVEKPEAKTDELEKECDAAQEPKQKEEEQATTGKDERGEDDKKQSEQLSQEGKPLSVENLFERQEDTERTVSQALEAVRNDITQHDLALQLLAFDCRIKTQHDQKSLFYAACSAVKPSLKFGAPASAERTIVAARSCYQTDQKGASPRLPLLNPEHIYPVDCFMDYTGVAIGLDGEKSGHLAVVAREHRHSIVIHCLSQINGLLSEPPGEERCSCAYLKPHPRFLHAYGVFPSPLLPTHIYVLWEPPLANVRDVLDDGTIFSEEDCQTIATQLAEALTLLAEKGIVLRNLNGGNVALTCQVPLCIKLHNFSTADFDNSNCTCSDYERTTNWKPTSFTAPELRQYPSVVSCASDIYSFGAVVTSLAYRGESPADVVSSGRFATEPDCVPNEWRMCALILQVPSSCLPFQRCRAFVAAYAQAGTAREARRASDGGRTVLAAVNASLHRYHRSHRRHPRGA
eukprot:TRINITY_DN167_c1_g1_i3.p1 TRINITY_DN167_c1_g1~~TRINITY_DN167_c1_g1_i3.p1  ORF type:complete len:591 (+),score=115.31 TRINITY_DN167_c1_g1_i3:172-1944(+)